MPDISLIIPAYNEEHRLPGTLHSCYDFLSRHGKSFEMLIVDDGSVDGTADLVERFADDHPHVKLLSYQPNRGKGHAVRTGIMKAEGDLLLLNDADGSSPIPEMVRLEAGIADGADIAIGSRAKPDESRRVNALMYRKLMGNTFNLIVQNLLLPGLYDTQCGFKMFKRDVARDIFSVTRFDGFSFDVEALYIAKTRGYKITEVAINWSNVEGSKVNVLVDSPKMFFDVVSIAVSSWLGKYRQNGKLNA